MIRIRRKTADDPLARAVCDELHSLRHGDQIDRLAHDPHLARDLGLDQCTRPDRPRVPWVMPF